MCRADNARPAQRQGCSRYHTSSSAAQPSSSSRNSSSAGLGDPVARTLFMLLDPMGCSWLYSTLDYAYRCCTLVTACSGMRLASVMWCRNGAAGMKGDDMTICPSCNYPHPEPDCPNPRCYANPAVSDATKARWRDEEIQRQQEKEERAKLHRAMAMSFNYRSTA